MAAWLDAHLPDTCRILVSPADRAQQTAQALNRKFKTVAELAPGASVAAVLAAANWPDRASRSLIVGHQPTLGMVASFLLAGEEAYWSISKGAVWWLSNRAKEDGASVVLQVSTECRFPITKTPAGLPSRRFHQKSSAICGPRPPTRRARPRAAAP